jgi:hypothetical protein
MEKSTFGTQSASQVFQSDLLKDEKILWTGQPEQKLFCGADFYLVPMGLFVFCFSLFWEYGASGITRHHADVPFPFSAFPLFGIPFVLMGCYMLFGRFFFKSWKQRNTYYAVTNSRALILCTVPSRSLQAVLINANANLNKSVRADGVGTISFGSSSPRAAMYANTGMDFFAAGAGGSAIAPAFYDIKDVNTVFQLISNQQKN